MTRIVDPLSTCSLYLQTRVNGNDLGSASGFVVNHGNQKFLITNYHVLAGRHPDTDAPVSPTLGIPDEIVVLHHASAQLGAWRFTRYPLLNENGTPKWIVHPAGHKIDVVALPLGDVGTDIATYPLDLSLAATDLLPQPGMPAFVIGFPFGMGVEGAWPVWKTGHIASDPDLDYDGKPCLLLDATTRGGMSGAPVVVRMSGGFSTRSGNFMLAGGMTTLLLGVYSGRTHDTSEIGIVWKPPVIQEILALYDPGREPRLES